MLGRKIVEIILGLCLACPAHAQDQLAFSSNQRTVPSKFEFELDPITYREIQNISGEKLEIENAKITFNREPLKVKSCKTRGNTTLMFQRKSFSISLEEPIEFKGKSIKKLAVNNLSMDQNYWRTRLCFLLMESLGIFPLKNEYTELSINGETQGTYLMIQKPDDYCQVLVVVY